MKLELVRYRCATCANSFDAPEIGSNAYGEFLLRSKSGETAYLNALSDKSYDDVDLLLSMKQPGLTYETDRVKVLREIYGEVACDRDANGEVFVLDAHPACPKCGGQRMDWWEVLEPIQIVEAEISSVQHSTWNSLSALHRKSRVDSALQKREAR